MARHRDALGRSPLISLGLCFLSLPIWAGDPSAGAPSTKLLHARPESVGMNSEKLAEIDRLVREAQEARRLPGCVVLLARRGKIVFCRAYGDKQLVPERVAMTTETLFDLASLTKPIATATSVMRLIEDGKLRLDDPVVKHLPEFAPQGKDRITVYELLTHQSGLLPDNALRDYEAGPEEAWKRICALKLQAEPGTKFIYSDVGYVVLGELVRRVSGKSLHEFTQERIFRPLQLQDTQFLPRAGGIQGEARETLRRRAAPTEQRDGHWMQGEVHDPRAYLLGGVAGHAGLFSTAEELAVYAQLLIRGGAWAGVRVLSERTVALMTAGYPVPGGLRGLGWDMQTGYSSNRGETFSRRAFGHGGFTGTGLWMDPELDLTVVFLSNRVHPDGTGAVNPLIGRIGTVAANSIVDRPQATLRLGIDVLERDAFRGLAGRRVGLITNHTGVNRAGRRTVDILHQAPDVKLLALFSPEHGLQGKQDVARIADGRDEATGLPVYSLYGETRRPSAQALAGLDTLVFDIQDIGTRFYTYISTMGLAMQAAAEQRLRFVVLDRPNPLGATEVAGPMLDAGRESFVGFHRLPVQHGLTIGELAGLFKAELQLELDLQVIRVEGWRRSETFEQTGLTWINPSPNMRSPGEALLYPGIGLLEMTNLSVGRGTEIPFEVLGAPWLDGSQLADQLNALNLPGVQFVPIVFTPVASKFAKERCGGVRLVVTDRRAYRSVHTGLQIARQLRLQHAGQWKADAYMTLLGNQTVLQAVLDGRPVAEIESGYAAGLEEFRQRRSRFLLYE